jgi:hypothetical protein
MKRRIDSLLQSGRNEEAINLAKEANLVCRGAAFVAWDDAEKVAVAQDEIYQPSLQILSERSAVPASIMSDLPEIPEPTSRLCSSEFFVRQVFRWNETKGLVKELNRAIRSAFGGSNGRKLARVVLDWAKQANSEQVRDAVKLVLRECQRNPDAEHLRKVLSAFFLALPERWRSEATSVFATLTHQPKSSERAWRSFLRLG